jgi:hypothetical protein
VYRCLQAESPTVSERVKNQEVSQISTSDKFSTIFPELHRSAASFRRNPIPVCKMEVSGELFL